MLKTALYALVNDSREYNNLNPISKEDFIKALSRLELMGVVETDGDEIHVVKEAVNDTP